MADTTSRFPNHTTICPDRKSISSPHTTVFFREYSDIGANRAARAADFPERLKA